MEYEDGRRIIIGDFVTVDNADGSKGSGRVVSDEQFPNDRVAVLFDGPKDIRFVWRIQVLLAKRGPGVKE